MQQNQVLEIWVKQLWEQQLEASNYKERSNNHQTKNDCLEEDKVESNAPSKETRREDSPPREPEAVNTWWEDKMKAMKDRMDFMKNAMKGWIATLDDLVHCADSLFIVQVTSCSLPPKFRMPSLESYDGAKDPIDHLESFKTFGWTCIPLGMMNSSHFKFFIPTGNC